MVTGDFKPLVCRISFLLLHSTSQVISGKRLNVHIIMDDPAGNSYIQVSMLTSHCTEGGCTCVGHGSCCCGTVMSS